MNEKGFTFISILVMINIIFMTIPLATYLTKTVDFDSSYDQLSTQQFFFFLRDETAKATAITIEPSTLTFIEADGTSASMEKYDDMIVKRTDGGFEVFLRQVKDVQFTSSPYGLHASIKTMSGDQFEKIIVDYN